MANGLGLRVPLEWIAYGAFQGLHTLYWDSGKENGNYYLRLRL